MTYYIGKRVRNKHHELAIEKRLLFGEGESVWNLEKCRKRLKTRY